MILSITSLATTMSFEREVLSLRAIDASGYFGIRHGHADLLTVLDIGMISWLETDGREKYCAVSSGILRVRGGSRVEIASREAIIDDDPGKLEFSIIAQFRQRDEAERRVHSESKRLELQMIREIMRYLRPINSITPRSVHESR